MKKTFPLLVNLAVWLSIPVVMFARRRYIKDKVQRLRELVANRSTFETSEGKLDYQSVGQGKPILVFHGLLGTFEHGRNAMWQFDRNTYRVISVSRPGYTLDETDNVVSPEVYNRLLTGLLDELRIEEVTVVTMSAGGPHALNFVAEHSDRVDKLILLEAISKAFDYDHVELLSAFSLMMKTVNSDPLAWLVTNMVNESLPLVATFSPDLQQRILNHPARHEVYKTVTRSFFPIKFMQNGYAYDVEYLKNLPQLPLENITCPTLILHGNADSVVPLEHSQHTYQHIPDSKFIIIQGDADHDFHITHPKPVWNAIFEFLEKEEHTMKS